MSSCGTSSCGKSSKANTLCPFAFGLAMGLASAIAMLICALWMMYGGAAASNVTHMAITPPANAGEIVTWMGTALLKGFLFGFVLAWLYDLIICCKAKCCKSTGGEGGCGNPSCGCK